MNAINTRLKHGLAVITRQQTKGRGIIFHFLLYAEIV